MELHVLTGMYTLQVAGRSQDFGIDRFVFYDESRVSIEDASNKNLQEPGRDDDPILNTKAPAMPRPTRFPTCK
jgi:hypothetical protein